MIGERENTTQKELKMSQFDVDKAANLILRMKNDKAWARENYSKEVQHLFDIVIKKGKSVRIDLKTGNQVSVDIEFDPDIRDFWSETFFLSKTKQSCLGSALTLILVNLGFRLNDYRPRKSSSFNPNAMHNTAWDLELPLDALIQTTNFSELSALGVPSWVFLWHCKRLAQAMGENFEYPEKAFKKQNSVLAIGYLGGMISTYKEWKNEKQ